MIEKQREYQAATGYSILGIYIVVVCDVDTPASNVRSSFVR
jgi:hypothetical protein